MTTTYAYYLRNRVTNKLIDLGSSAILTDDAARENGIDQSNWSKDWQFSCEVTCHELPGAPWRDVLVLN